MALVKPKLPENGKMGTEDVSIWVDYTNIRGTGDGFTNKFTCNFIEGEGNTGWEEAYYINPADIKRFLNRNRDEKLPGARWQDMIDS